ncbi:MAG: hypothetical protein V7603_903 [Micromonosporaceae bacterium]
MDDPYADFIAEVSAGGFTPAPAGEWNAEQIAAHVARNHEELIRTTEAVLSGEQATFDNREPTDAGELDRYVLAYRGLRGLADRIAETVVTLRELSSRLAECGPVTVPVHIKDGERVVVDEPLPWRDVLAMDESAHVRGHLAQLRARRG